MNAATPGIPRDYRATGTWANSKSMICLAAGLALTIFGSMNLLGGDAAARLQFKYSYLAAFMFVLSGGLGALFFVMIQHITGAKWSISVRRIAEQIMTTILPLSFILFFPILAWLPDLYPWARPSAAADPILAGKLGYLNRNFFLYRACLYFFVWNYWALLLKAKSLKQDRTADPAVKLSMSRWSAPGILLFALTVTFASFDWLMSLSPKWASTIYGVYYFAGCVIVNMAVLILLSMSVSKSGDVGEAIRADHFHNMGKILFGFNIFWAYIAFSQFLLIWMANFPEEARYFLDRWQAPGWKTCSYVLIFGHFVIPFLYLLPRTIKRCRPTLAAGAVWMLAIDYFDMFYLVMPAYNNKAVALSLREPMLGFGFLLIAVSLVFMSLRQAPLLPSRDPYLKHSMTFENF